MNCFPGLVELMDQTKQRLANEELARAAAAAEAAKPISRLRQAYLNYMVVKKCYDVRLGYQLVYINEIEMERARDVVKA
jgi:hypothetical protein